MTGRRRVTGTDTGAGQVGCRPSEPRTGGQAARRLANALRALAASLVCAAAMALPGVANAVSFGEDQPGLRALCTQDLLPLAGYTRVFAD